MGKKILMENLINRYSVKYVDIDFDTQQKLEVLKVLDRKTGKKFNFTKELLLDQFIIPWIERMTKRKEQA